jgi:hypothetical protein
MVINQQSWLQDDQPSERRTTHELRKWRSFLEIIIAISFQKMIAILNAIGRDRLFGITA